MSSFFFHPVFRDAIVDIESLGVKVHANPKAGAKKYAVVGGRSNARWWLIPLENRRLTVSGLALFQPMLASARVMKFAVKILSVFGLSRMWARNTVYISGESILSEYFPSAKCGCYFAYFTGTDSPHRKVAVQIMDRFGNIKGFAKVTRNPLVEKLLKHEAATLVQLQTYDLQSAHIPKVIFSGEQNGSALLVTDTLKTPSTRSKSRFSKAHKAFILELAQKSASTNPLMAHEIGSLLRARFKVVKSKLDPIWQQRIEVAINYLEVQYDVKLETNLIHGDFTPWNTFFVEGKLYVFDWEYAETKYPSSFDLIHFLLADRKHIKNDPEEEINYLADQIKTTFKLISKNDELFHITIYLITVSLRYIERSDDNVKFIKTWDSEKEHAELFDTVTASVSMLSCNL